MINYIKGDLLSVEDGIIIHGCNCSGGFGSGIAGQIRKQWPKVYERFKEMPIGEGSLGKINFIQVQEDPKLLVVNCFTQLTYGTSGARYASPDAIDMALFRVLNQMVLWNMNTINSPKIGCGLGGLNWDTDVLPIFEELNSLYSDVNINIYEL